MYKIIIGPNLKEIVPLEQLVEAGPPLEPNSRHVTGNHSIIGLSLMF